MAGDTIPLTAMMQRQSMNGQSPRQSPGSAGGVFIAILALAGVFIGGFQGQPTIGLLGGLALGGLVALALWWRQRPR